MAERGEQKIRYLPRVFVDGQPVQILNALLRHLLQPRLKRPLGRFGHQGRVMVQVFRNGQILPDPVAGKILCIGRLQNGKQRIQQLGQFDLPSVITRCGMDVLRAGAHRALACRGDLFLMAIDIFGRCQHGGAHVGVRPVAQGTKKLGAVVVHCIAKIIPRQIGIHLPVAGRCKNLHCLGED